MTPEILQALAQRLFDDCFEAHRGAFWWNEDQRLAVVFGNDSVPAALLTADQICASRELNPRATTEPGERSTFEVAAIRRLLADHGGTEVGFATAEGATWVLGCLLPASLSPDVLEGTAWLAWHTISYHRAHNVPGPATLNWEAIHRGLRQGRFRSVEGCFVGYQANVAHAVLERNGLL
jgi:hypothetical protein